MFAVGGDAMIQSKGGTSCQGERERMAVHISMSLMCVERGLYGMPVTVTVLIAAGEKRQLVNSVYATFLLLPVHSTPLASAGW